MRSFQKIPRWPIPYTVLAVSLLLTSITAWLLWDSLHQTQTQRFHSETAQIQNLLGTRMNAYEAILRSTSSMITVNPLMDNISFRTYVNHLNIPINYPGVQGIGYSMLVKPGETAALITRMQAEGMTDFKLWPATDQTERHAIIYLEPLDERNKRAIGYDMFSEPVRREAMQRARDTGQPASTARVTLVQEDGAQAQPGFLIYVPVYRITKGEMPQTVEQRRQALVGFAYSPFRVNDLISNVLAPVANNPIHIQIYDGNRPIDSQRIYQNTSAASASNTFKETQQLLLAGNQWTIVYSSPANYETSIWSIIITVLLVGMSFGIALFIFSSSQIRARQQAEEAVSVRDSFLWVASHELRSPLTALLGNAQLLEMRTMRDNSLAEREQNNLQTVIRQGLRMNRMISVLLDHAQIQTGTLSVNPQPMDLVPLAQKIIKDLRDSTDQHSIRLEGLEHLLILGDDLRLEQVFYNLINNAIKYSPKGGEITIRLLQESDQGIIHVSDQGLGIPAKDQKRLFNEFYRASNVKEAKINGSGLGLYVVHEIIRQHNGKISIESELGKGSTFTIQLPLA